MRSKALLSKSALLKTRTAAQALPLSIADLGACELVAHCDGCGRHFQLYPGHAGFGDKIRLVSLLEQLVCSARRKGDACGGRPRRLILTRDERRWVLESSGDWIEDESQFWEHSDFEARAAQGRPAAF